MVSSPLRCFIFKYISLTRLAYGIVLFFITAQPNLLVVDAVTYTTITTAYNKYYLGDMSTSYSGADAQCQADGYTGVALMFTNAEYDALLAAMTANSATYGSTQYWVNIPQDDSDDFSFYNEEINEDYWRENEPSGGDDEDCVRMRNYFSGESPEKSHALADYSCDGPFYFICSVYSITTSTAATKQTATTTTTPATTTTQPATTTTQPATTTTQPITTTTQPATTTTQPATTTTQPATTTTQPATTTTQPATTTTQPATTTTQPATTTTQPATTTTQPATTTTQPATTTTQPATTTTQPVTTTTQPATTTTQPATTTTQPATTTTQPATTTTQLATTTTQPATTDTTTVTTLAATEVELALIGGQQMSVVYIGLIIGGSLGMSCVCSGIWLTLNKCRKKERVKEKETTDSDSDEEC